MKKLLYAICAWSILFNHAIFSSAITTANPSAQTTITNPTYTAESKDKETSPFNRIFNITGEDVTLTLFDKDNKKSFSINVPAISLYKNAQTENTESDLIYFLSKNVTGDNLPVPINLKRKSNRTMTIEFKDKTKKKNTKKANADPNKVISTQNTPEKFDISDFFITFSNDQFNLTKLNIVPSTQYITALQEQLKKIKGEADALNTLKIIQIQTAIDLQSKSSTKYVEALQNNDKKKSAEDTIKMSVVTTNPDVTTTNKVIIPLPASRKTIINPVFTGKLKDKETSPFNRIFNVTGEDITLTLFDKDNKKSFSIDLPAISIYKQEQTENTQEDLITFLSKNVTADNLPAAVNLKKKNNRTMKIEFKDKTKKKNKKKATKDPNKVISTQNTPYDFDLSDFFITFDNDQFNFTKLNLIPSHKYITALEDQLKKLKGEADDLNSIKIDEIQAAIDLQVMFSTEYIKLLQDSHKKKKSAENFIKMTVVLTNSALFTMDEVKAFKKNQIEALTPIQMDIFTPEQFEIIMPQLSAQQMKDFSFGRTGTLSKNSAQALTKDQIDQYLPNFSSQIIGYLSQNQVQALTTEQIESMTKGQAGGLNKEYLTPDQLQITVPMQSKTWAYPLSYNNGALATLAKN